MEGGFPTVAQIWQFLSYPTSFSPIQGLSAHGKTITGTHTHTDSHTLPHSLIHTEDTYVLSPPGNGFLLIFENTRNRERKNNLALSRKFVPLKINNPSWDLDLRGEQGALFLSHNSCVWTCKKCTTEPLADKLCHLCVQLLFVGVLILFNESPAHCKLIFLLSPWMVEHTQQTKCWYV